ncbi:MAG: deoxyribose-phosphate aldolase [Chloroflexota bacterium]
MLTLSELAQLIDHSILHPSFGDAEFRAGIEVAVRYGVGCVVPQAWRIPQARELLAGTGIRLCCPIGFPQGLNAPEIKRAEAEWALRHGAVELDMVMNISALKSGDYALVARDIAGVVAIAKDHGAPVKVILECCLLTDAEKVAACQIAEANGARWVKTSTQTQPGGATVEDIRLMRATVGPSVGVKASGYITDVDKALALYEAGARRLGTGYTALILEGLRARGGS